SLRRPALLIDRKDTLFKIDARLDRAEYIVGCAEEPVEQIELLVQKLVNALVRFVALVEKINDDHVMLLAVTVASPNALLDPLRVPRQVIVDYKRAELQVDAFRRRLRGDHDRHVAPEMLDQSGAGI